MIIFLSQNVELYFTYGHRRSCSILQRNSTEDPVITERLRNLLHDQIEDDRDNFTKINQEGCDYDKESVNIDQVGERDSELGAIVNLWSSELEFDRLNNTIDQIKDDILANLWD